jgi:molybdate transport system regulatory protein
MQLKVGDKVIAFFKASHVLVGTGLVIPISARNKLQGVIKTVTRGAVNSEIAVKLPSGDILSAIITNEAVEDMALQDGDDVVAIIKSSDVMIAKQ